MTGDITGWWNINLANKFTDYTVNGLFSDENSLIFYMDLLNIRGVNLYKSYKNIQCVQLRWKNHKYIIDKPHCFQYCEDVRNTK